MDYRNPGGGTPKAAGPDQEPRSAGVSGRRAKGMDGKPGDMPFREKPGFPSADLPGKSGPDRSAGVTKVRQHPKSVGL